MFLDKAKIHVQSGAGGNGMVAWRREKYVPHGGPAGGDGGRGGNVYLEATDSLNTLLDFKYRSIFKAGDGDKGRSKNQHGKGGEDIVIHVPCGTIVRDADTQQAIADLTIAGDRVLVATGGRGGRGNARFVSSVRQSPQFSEPGEPGIERELELELKLIADVGIIGLPNAGKSTLISVISAAKPKIADYPFTTLTPNLGVVRKPSGDGIIVADIPGLIEGASTGAGLGHEFLRHVERTRVLLHLVDVSAGLLAEDAQEDVTTLPLQHYVTINQELEQYSPRLAKKPQILVLSKTDSVSEEQLDKLVKAFQSRTEAPLYTVSSITRQGLEALLSCLFETLDNLPPEEEVVEVVPDIKAFDNDDSHFEVYRSHKNFVVEGGKVDRLVGVTDMRNSMAVHRLMNILKAMGVFEALKQEGAEPGDTVLMSGLEFEYVPEEDGPYDTPRRRNT